MAALLTQPLAPTIILHVSDVDQVTICNALRRSTLKLRQSKSPDAYYHWLNSASPMEDDDPDSAMWGSFPIANFRELQVLLAILHGITCNTYLWIEGLAETGAVSISLQEEKIQADWRCDTAKLAQGLSEAIEQSRTILNRAVMGKTE